MAKVERSTQEVKEVAQEVKEALESMPHVTEIWLDKSNGLFQIHDPGTYKGEVYTENESFVKMTREEILG